MQLDRKIVIATHNAGKLREFSDLFVPLGIEVVSAQELHLSSPDETGETFCENAILKARAASSSSKLLALADDSGLCVNALEGRPGIFSARWADSQGGFRGAMQRIQSELSASPDRSAFFICVLALAWPSGRVETVEGRIDGTISLTPRGDHGHGYDPIFVPKGRTHTFAEMTESDKNAISHRGLAFDALKAKFL